MALVMVALEGPVVNFFIDLVSYMCLGVCIIIFVFMLVALVVVTWKDRNRHGR